MNKNPRVKRAEKITKIIFKFVIQPLKRVTAMKKDKFWKNMFVIILTIQYPLNYSTDSNDLNRF